MNILFILVIQMYIFINTVSIVNHWIALKTELQNLSWLTIKKLISQSFYPDYINLNSLNNTKIRALTVWLFLISQELLKIHSLPTVSHASVLMLCNHGHLKSFFE